MTEDSWAELIARIDDGAVIPIVGQDLLTVQTATGVSTVYAELANRLAQDLNVDLATLRRDFRITDVICASSIFHEQPQKIYYRIKVALDGLKARIPEPLRQLAEITPLRLFVTTTFDTLLQQALDQVRHQERRENKTKSVAYSPNNLCDLPVGYDPSFETLVFHLLGRVSSSPDYAATEGDLLEFMHTLQSADSRPNRLIDELKKRHILLLGNNFPDWLGRFLLRLAKAERLWNRRDRSEMVAGAETEANGSLARFVGQFSCETTMFEGDAVEFVRELHQRWTALHPADNPNASAVEAPTPLSGDQPTPLSIFISYSRDDLPAVQRLKSTLEAELLHVWFDKDDLKPGDQWERCIREGIDRCAAFVPVISVNTEGRDDAVFRAEWAMALKRLEKRTGSKRPFLFPVVLDEELAYQTRQVPREFLEANWTVAPEGQVPADFPKTLLDLVRQIRLRENRPS